MTRLAGCRPAIAALLPSALLAAATPAGSADYPPRWEETVRERLEFADPAAERQLVVDGLWGGIRVTGSDGAAVELVVRHVIRANDDAAVDRARREVTLQTSREGGRIELVVDGPFRDRVDGRRWRWNEWDPDFEAVYDFEIRVPRSTGLRLATVLDGDVVVEGVEGRLELSNVVGDVRVRAASPTTGVLKTVGGEMRAELSGAPQEAMRFETVSGDIEVTFPANLDADARLETQWGELYSEFEVELLPVEPVIRKRDGGWSLEGATPAVRIGRGGPLLSFETLSGDIYLRKAGR